MKKLLVIAATVAAAAALPVSAQAGELILREPVSGQVLLCNGHNAELSGTQLIVGAERRTPSGGLMLAFHIVPMGVQAVDLVTGTVYRQSGSLQDLFLITPAGGSITTIVSQLRLQAPGGDTGLVVTENLHFVVSPDGTLRAFVDLFVTCY